jgi:transcriptional regulator with XRE-family HTH domain
MIVAITPHQCRAGRALLNWTQERLSIEACISPNTLRRFESGQSLPNRATLGVIRFALEAGGVRFIGDDGVTLSPGKA